MEFERLFTALVIGGSVIAGGCASKSTSSDTTNANTTVAATPAAQDAAADEAIDCAKVCDMPDGERTREMICPDPDLGADNCCWLMSNPHECCP